MKIIHYFSKLFTGVLIDITSKEVDFARQLNQANEESNREAPDGECRQQIHTMMKSRKSDMVVAFIVFVNALFIGLETDAPESHRSFYMEVDLVFTAAYVIEIVLRFLALKRFIWYAISRINFQNLIICRSNDTFS